MSYIDKYYDLDDGFELEISVAYQLGGTNWGTGKNEERGLYLHIDTVKRGDHFVQRQLYGDLSGNKIKTGKILMKPLKRKSQKQVDILIEKTPFDEIAKLWISGNYPEAFELIEKTKEEIA